MPTRIQTSVFVSLYERHGTTWGWDSYADAISDAQHLTGERRLNAADVRKWVNRNRKDLLSQGINVNLRPTIDADLLCELYAKHGDALSWAEYAKLLSDELGATGEDRIKAPAVSVYVSRNRESLGIAPRRVVADVEFPWPGLNAKAYRQTYWWRFLGWEARARKLGEGVLEDDHGTLKRWKQQRAKLIRKREVIRYDPDRGLYIDKAHGDEIGSLVENLKYFFQRNPNFS